MNKRGGTGVILIAIIILAVELSGSNSKPAQGSPAYHNYRLSNTTLPTLYDLSIHPNLTSNTWNGNLTIFLNVTTTTNLVYLHLHPDYLTISSYSLRNNNSNNLIKGRGLCYAANEYWVMLLNQEISPGNYSLSLVFNGTFKTDVIVGFYRSQYSEIGSDGKSHTKYLATTKFEPTYARRAFPCFDEPNKKARFRIRLVRDPATLPLAISNMPEESSSELLLGGVKVLGTQFQTSVPMSTYLVCFIASDFASIKATGVGVNKITVRAYGPKNRYNQMSYALNVTKVILPYYEEYFGIHYALPKLDIVSVPDFISGAMENWGIVTFRETRILVSDTSTIANRIGVANTVAHELAHQWFGNLVTMDWWSDLWLNEGFADFVCYTKGLSHFRPDWNANKNVKVLMDTWTTQMGYPVITLNGNGKIAQTRFYANKQDAGKPGNNLVWMVPISYETNKLQSHAFVLNDTTPHQLTGPSSSWTKVNVRTKGYYRVNYATSGSGWPALAAQLASNFTVWAPSDRSGLVDDSFALASAGLLNYTTPLCLLKGYIGKETSFLPWHAASAHLSYITAMLGNDTHAPAFEAYRRNISGPVVDGLGWNMTGMGDMELLLVRRVVPIAAAAGHNHTLAHLTNLFKAWINNPNTAVPTLIRSSVLRYGIRQSDNAAWNTTWSRYLNASVTEAAEFRSALAMSKDPNTLQRYLKLAENSNYVRAQDYFTTLRYISANPIGTQMVYNYVKTNWDKLVARFTLNDRYFGKTLAYITATFNTNAQLEDMLEFFAAHPKAGAGAGPRKQAKATVEANILWMNDHFKPIQTWLTNPTCS